MLENHPPNSVEIESTENRTDETKKGVYGNHQKNLNNYTIKKDTRKYLSLIPRLAGEKNVRHNGGELTTE